MPIIRESYEVNKPLHFSREQKGVHSKIIRGPSYGFGGPPWEDANPKQTKHLHPTYPIETAEVLLR